MGLPIDNYTGGVLDRQTVAILGAYWRDQRFAYTGNNMIYRGVHYLHDAEGTDTNWEIWKYTYDGNSNLVRIEGPLRGAWDSRTSLDWGV